jgi:subtilisin family serine protease
MKINIKNNILSVLVSVSLMNVAIAEEVTLVVKKLDSDKYIKIVVDAAEVEMIRESELYASVEEDVWVKTPRPVIKQKDEKQILSKTEKSKSQNRSNTQRTDEYVPNDPDFEFQYYFKDKSEFEGSSEILKGINKSVQNKKLRIAVIDGGFEDHEDLDWAYGYNFFDMWGEVRGPEFRDLTDEQKDCSGGHGLGVASIIGAKSNNVIGMAGVVDADMIALRAMSCGLGPLSAVAEAILHAAGEDVDDIPAILQVDMINISMAGEFHTCPSYLQSAIDVANEKGIMIFVAAGNQNIDSNDVVPAKCTGIFVSGATEQNGYKTTFSNYGSKVDAMMAGMDVIGYTSNGITGWWEGTSQASPLALGIAALGLQHNPELTRDELFTYLKATAESIREDVPSAEQDCSGDRCGTGLLHADKFMDYVLATTNGGVYRLHHALSPESTCDQELFLSQLGNTLQLCQMYEFVITDGEGKNENKYQLFKIVKGESITEGNAEFLLASDEKTVLLEGVDLESYDYGVKICLNDACDSTPIIKLDTDETAQPLICQ